MKFALCQMLSGDDKTENLAQITDFTQRVVEGGASLAIFPEFAQCFEPVMSASFIAQAESLDGPFVRHITDLAQRHGIAIVAGMLEEISGEDRAYNTLIAVDPSGELRTYRKLHLYDAFGYLESNFVRPGEPVGPVTFDIDGVRVGLLTCYDLRFPEAARQHADAGTQLLAYPAAWIPGPRKEGHWRALSLARAIENTFYVGAVSQAPRVGVGSSIIVDPMGLVLGELGEVPGIAFAEVDPERIEQVRASNPCLVNRRFEVIPR